MTACESLHEWANSLPTFQFPFDNAKIALNGIPSRHTRDFFA
jgi:hypothetical protein